MFANYYDYPKLVNFLMRLKLEHLIPRFFYFKMCAQLNNARELLILKIKINLSPFYIKVKPSIEDDDDDND